MSSEPRILCVDDHFDTLEGIAVLLAIEGFAVTCASTAYEALRIAKDQGFDAYLLDNWLPDISGIELCRQIRKFDAHAPILFLSGAGYDVDKIEALEAGAQCYLTKPADGDELIRALRMLIETPQTTTNI